MTDTQPVLKVANVESPRGQTYEVSAHLDRPIQSFTWDKGRFPRAFATR